MRDCRRPSWATPAWAVPAVVVLIGATVSGAAPFSTLFSGVNGAGVHRTVMTVPLAETADRDGDVTITTVSVAETSDRDGDAPDEGPVDNPFFASLGTNGRTCLTCHTPADGWSITPANVLRRFLRSAGLEPLFRTNDGATSPLADVSTLAARRAAYGMLLTKGLIRVGLSIPAAAEFALADVDDPYGYASVRELSLFRRPLPSTNLRFLSTVMWDGRQTFPGLSIRADLADQANGATVGHAQGAPLAESVRAAIVDFEMSLFTAQWRDRQAGRLEAEGATGGPRALATQPFWPRINSPEDPTRAPMTLRVFTMFDAWASAVGPESAPRQAIARGQALFNTRLFGRRSTCSGCHNAPNVGSNSVGHFVNLGISDESRRTSDLPLYTLACTSGPHAGRTVRSSDPGLALITGRCADIGRFKVPTLRALASRPPYFHNGLAPTLEAVVDFYDERFAMGLTEGEKADLVAFLKAL